MLRYENTVVVALDDLPYLNSFPFEYNSPQWKEFMRSDDKEEPYSTFVDDALFLFTYRLFDIRVDRTHLVFD